MSSNQARGDMIFPHAANDDTTLLQQPWPSVNIVDFGAKGDNYTDNTEAIHRAFQAVNGGGEVLVPEGGVFQTAPFNLSSNVILRVEGTLRGIEEQDKFPVIAPPPSYGREADAQGKARRHPLVYAYSHENITITGSGTIDGAGWYWYPQFLHRDPIQANNIGRPHLVEIYNCHTVVISGVRFKDPAFWTLHLLESRDVHIHDTRFEAPYCRNYKCPNTDGIDVDSCENVLIEKNHISVGDDHVTVIAGRRKRKAKVCRNVTVRDNILGTGMGLSVGSGTAGGVEDVLFQNNVMTSRVGQLGQGIHIKTRSQYGGYVRRISWIDNVFHVAGRYVVCLCMSSIICYCRS